MVRLRAGFVGLLAVALCVGGAGLRGQEKGRGEAEAKKRPVHPVKAGSAREFAAASARSEAPPVPAATLWE